MPTSKEQRLERLYKRLPNIKCKRLCQECCGPIAMSSAEADRIASRFPELGEVGGRRMPIKLASGQDIGVGFVTDCLVCPLLKNGECSAYAIRPLICRLWGLVQDMRCPHGCTPDRWVSPRESFKLLEEARTISEARIG